MTLILHDLDFDEDSYKVRLLLGLIGLEHHRLRPDLPAGIPASEFAESADVVLPCLIDGDVVLEEVEAILAYLARRYDWRDRWLPADDPALFGQALAWLAFAGRKLRAVGLIDPLFGIPPDDPEALEAARRAFRQLERHLTTRALDGALWCVGRTPTVADVAVFPALALSERAGVDLDPYPAIRRWMREFSLLPGFVAVPAMPAADEPRLAPGRRLAPRPPVPVARGGNVVALPAAKGREPVSRLG